jgi:L-ascorbate metabolism protein UlaG (beta-lactamase superfamily)
MDITWLAHSCFRIRSANATILTDPFPSSLGGSVGAVEENPGIVTLSSRHPNHSDVSGLSGDFRLINGPGEYAVGGLYVKGIMTPASPEPNALPPLRNTAYLFEMEGLRLCHLGDLAGPLSDKHVDELSPMDVLFVPVGGRCTLSLDRLGVAVRRLEARLVVPMHYKIPGVDVDLEGLEPFLREMGIRELEPQPRLTVTATNLPAETTVVVLKALAIPEEPAP